MADIFLHFKNRFKENPALCAEVEPLLRERVDRTDAETADYEQWKRSAQRAEMLVWLARQFTSFKRNPESTHDGIDFLFSASSKGFRLHPALTKFSDRSVVHLFHYLKERALTLGYGESISDTRIYRRPYWEETLQRHVVAANNLHESCFGDESENGLFTFASLTIEMLHKNDKLVNLRMEATIPASDMPRSANDFDELMQSMAN